MRKFLALVLLSSCAGLAQARYLGVGVDAFNRVVPASSTEVAIFSPLSFEIDSVAFSETVDPIRRSIFASALHVMDQFEEEFRPLARMPFEQPGTNGIDLVWAHALVVDEPSRLDPSFRLTVQELYGVEVCRAKPAYGIEAWIRTRFAGEFDGWRLPVQTNAQVYSFYDLVSVSARVAPTNGWTRACPTYGIRCQPLVGGASFYALVPKSGRSISSIRARLTSATLDEILAGSKAVIDPPKPVRLSLPAMDFVSTNELAGAFSYFRFPTVALKVFPPGIKPHNLRQTAHFHLEVPTPAPEAEPLDGPFLFFIHDPVVNTIPVIGVFPGKGNLP